VPAAYVGPGQSVRALTVSPTAAALRRAQTLQLGYAGVDTAGAQMPDDSVPVRYATSNPGVAVVNAAGLVTAGNDGQALIFVTALANSNIEDTCVVDVSSAPPPLISLNPTSLTFTDSCNPTIQHVRQVLLSVDETINSPGGALQQFNAEWGRYLHLDVTDAIIMASGDIAEKYHLRAYDAIHLTSAIVLKNRLSARVVFASWDAALDVAARQIGLELLPKHPDPF